MSGECGKMEWSINFGALFCLTIFANFVGLIGRNPIMQFMKFKFVRYVYNL